MRAIKAKRLRREAKRLLSLKGTTQGVKPSLEKMPQRIEMWTGNAGEKKIYRDLVRPAGTVRHAEGMTRRIYQDMKKESKGS